MPSFPLGQIDNSGGRCATDVLNTLGDEGYTNEILSCNKNDCGAIVELNDDGIVELGGWRCQKMGSISLASCNFDSANLTNDVVV